MLFRTRAAIVFAVAAIVVAVMFARQSRVLPGRWGMEHFALGIPKGRDAGRAFLADWEHQKLVDAQWEKAMPDAAKRPALNRVKYGGGALQVMLEVIARQD